MKPGRNNEHIWSLVNWCNTNMAIARRLNCDPKAVRDQRKRRNKAPYRGRGGNKFNHPEYREGPVKLPINIIL